MVFPALFASGMALVDTLDNADGRRLRLGVQQTAAQALLHMTITGTSVVVALFIGGRSAGPADG